MQRAGCCDRDGMATCYLDGKVTATVSLAGLGNVDAGLPTVIGCDGIAITENCRNVIANPGGCGDF